MKVNTQELDNRISTSGFKIGFLCDQLGISRQAFNRKLGNSIPFRASEVYVLCDLLRISQDERTKFFCPEVDKDFNNEVTNAKN